VKNDCSPANDEIVNEPTSQAYVDMPLVKVSHRNVSPSLSSLSQSLINPKTPSKTLHEPVLGKREISIENPQINIIISDKLLLRPVH